MDYKLEVVVVPVSDVDRAKHFYAEQLGFHVDVDDSPNEHFRIVQMTPTGSGCSVTIGKGLADMAPGTLKGLQLCVADIEAAHAELSARGCRSAPSSTTTGADSSRARETPGTRSSSSPTPMATAGRSRRARRCGPRPASPDGGLESSEGGQGGGGRG